MRKIENTFNKLLAVLISLYIMLIYFKAVLNKTIMLFTFYLTYRQHIKPPQLKCKTHFNYKNRDEIENLLEKFNKLSVDVLTSKHNRTINYFILWVTHIGV